MIRRKAAMAMQPGVSARANSLVLCGVAIVLSVLSVGCTLDDGGDEIQAAVAATVEALDLQRPTATPKNAPAPTATLASPTQVPAPAEPSMSVLISTQPELSTFAELIDTVGLTFLLEDEGSNTLFAPTNDAFFAMGPELDVLRSDWARLRHLVEYHILPDAIDSASLAASQEVITIWGDAVSVSSDGGTIRLNDFVPILVADAVASDGYLHVISGVLLPPEFAERDPAPEPTALPRPQPTPHNAANSVDVYAAYDWYLNNAPFSNGLLTQMMNEVSVEQVSASTGLFCSQAPNYATRWEFLSFVIDDTRATTGDLFIDSEIEVLMDASLFAGCPAEAERLGSWAP